MNSSLHPIHAQEVFRGHQKVDLKMHRGGIRNQNRSLERIEMLFRQALYEALKVSFQFKTKGSPWLFLQIYLVNFKERSSWLYIISTFDLYLNIFNFLFVFEYYYFIFVLNIFYFVFEFDELAKILSLLRHLISGVVCHSKAQIMLSAPFLQFMITRSCHGCL